MHAADGGADLVVGIRSDVFQDEVQKAGIALEDGEDLQGAVGWAWRGRSGRLGRFGRGAASDCREREWKKSR
jgi:hypothetical protein